MTAGVSRNDSEPSCQSSSDLTSFQRTSFVPQSFCAYTLRSSDGCSRTSSKTLLIRGQSFFVVSSTQSPQDIARHWLKLEVKVLSQATPAPNIQWFPCTLFV